MAPCGAENSRPHIYLLHMGLGSEAGKRDGTFGARGFNFYRESYNPTLFVCSVKCVSRKTPGLSVVAGATFFLRKGGFRMQAGCNEGGYIRASWNRGWALELRCGQKELDCGEGKGERWERKGVRGAADCVYKYPNNLAYGRLIPPI